MNTDTTKLYPPKRTFKNKKDEIAFKRSVKRIKKSRTSSLKACESFGEKDECESKCDDCIWGQRNMREGRWQNIFEHWTAFL